MASRIELPGLNVLSVDSSSFASFNVALASEDQQDPALLVKGGVSLQEIQYNRSLSESLARQRTNTFYARTDNDGDESYFSGKLLNNKDAPNAHEVSLEIPRDYTCLELGVRIDSGLHVGSIGLKNLVVLSRAEVTIEGAKIEGNLEVTTNLSEVNISGVSVGEEGIVFTNGHVRISDSEAEKWYIKSHDFSGSNNRGNFHKKISSLSI